jgi:hypothetical protein
MQISNKYSLLKLKSIIMEEDHQPPRCSVGPSMSLENMNPQTGLNLKKK